ncbi:MAG: Hsp20/alpha crystallin family protein [Candidatus Magasanikbacteria bacterium]|nr:Hsp20/alpha crystallin family protein [Candidatus Magasanikbacteria bacterium]
MEINSKNGAFAMILEAVDSGNAQASARLVHAGEDYGDWALEHTEGKLAIDVAQNDTHIFVVSAMAGATPDRIEVYVHNDLLTIRGFRTNPLDEMKGSIDFFYTECFWGVFSRTIILPTDVQGDLSHAKYQSGILLVTIPKRQEDRKISIEVVEE